MTTTQMAGRHRLPRRPATVGPVCGMASMIVAAGAIGLLAAVVDDGPRTATVQVTPAAADLSAQDIQRTGRVTAARSTTSPAACSQMMSLGSVTSSSM